MRPEAKRPKAPQNEVHMARKSATVAPTVNQLQLPYFVSLPSAYHFLHHNLVELHFLLPCYPVPAVPCSISSLALLNDRQIDIRERRSRQHR